MTNQSSAKAKAKKDVPSSSKANIEKTLNEKGKKSCSCNFSTYFIQERIDWSALDAYKDTETGELLESHHLFEVEFVQDIMQQGSKSL
ncbi:hypothetical protein RDI58_022404 [Solanum bulbocastanum]|uniref:Uncharacterized protein n=1 Tax=Solanum bulbocastanum TaxID=147425 RepID=A0AAN8Y572_SOLBU